MTFSQLNTHGSTSSLQGLRCKPHSPLLGIFAFWQKAPAAFGPRYLQGKGQAVPHVVLIGFQLFDLLLQLQPLFGSLLQDLLPLCPELVLQSCGSFLVLLVQLPVKAAEVRTAYKEQEM